jgi:hypothetical protein
MKPDYILTRASALKAGACYSDDRLAELIPPEGLTPVQVAELPIPPEDRHWALCYAMGVPDATLRLHAVWCARRALARVENPDPRSVAACDTAERYALGQATDEELRAAWPVSWTAAWAANDAAWSAGSATASAAASAAWSASSASGAAAAWDAAKVAERVAQVQDLAERITNANQSINEIFRS